MPKSFHDLRARMSSEAQETAAKKASALLATMPDLAAQRTRILLAKWAHQQQPWSVRFWRGFCCLWGRHTGSQVGLFGIAGTVTMPRCGERRAKNLMYFFRVFWYPFMLLFLCKCAREAVAGNNDLALTSTLWTGERNGYPYCVALSPHSQA